MQGRGTERGSNVDGAVSRRTKLGASLQVSTDEFELRRQREVEHQRRALQWQRVLSIYTILGVPGGRGHQDLVPSGGS